MTSVHYHKRWYDRFHLIARGQAVGPCFLKMRNNFSRTRIFAQRWRNAYERRENARTRRCGWRPWVGPMQMRKGGEERGMEIERETTSFSPAWFAWLASSAAASIWRPVCFVFFFLSLAFSIEKYWEVVSWLGGSLKKLISTKFMNWW